MAVKKGRGKKRETGCESIVRVLRWNSDMWSKWKKRKTKIKNIIIYTKKKLLIATNKWIF